MFNPINSHSNVQTPIAQQKRPLLQQKVDRYKYYSIDLRTLKESQGGGNNTTNYQKVQSFIPSLLNSTINIGLSNNNSADLNNTLTNSISYYPQLKN